MKYNGEEIDKITYRKLIELAKKEREKILRSFKRSFVKCAKSPMEGFEDFEIFLRYFASGHPEGPYLSEEEFDASINLDALRDINHFLREVGEL